MSETEATNKRVELVVVRGTRCGDRDVSPGETISVPADDIEDGIYPARWWIKTGKARPAAEAQAILKAQEKAPEKK